MTYDERQEARAELLATKSFALVEPGTVSKQILGGLRLVPRTPAARRWLRTVRKATRDAAKRMRPQPGEIIQLNMSGAVRHVAHDGSWRRAPQFILTR